MVSDAHESNQAQQLSKMKSMPRGAAGFIPVLFVLFFTPPAYAAHTGIESVAPVSITYCSGGSCAPTPSALSTAIEAWILSLWGKPYSITCDFNGIPPNEGHGVNTVVCSGKSKDGASFADIGRWFPKCPDPGTGYNYLFNLVGTNMCDRYIKHNQQGSPVTSLSGYATTEPWHKKHDKEHLKANLPLKAIVTQNGQPKTNFAVTITTDVTSDSGGHVHTNGRPKGKLVDGTGVSTKAGKESINGNTNGSGVFEFTFGAEEASGTHTLTAKCDSGCQAPATATVDVGIKGLMLLDYGDGKSYTLTGHKEPHAHPGSHYFSPTATVKIINLALAYQRKFHHPLIINDSSLVKGGVFDIEQDWTYKSYKHGGHRVGVVVDINNYTINPTPLLEQFPSPQFERFAAIFGIQADPHPDPKGKHPMGTAPHYHLLLLGAGNDK